jgi:hypothetical protein
VSVRVRFDGRLIASDRVRSALRERPAERHQHRSRYSTERAPSSPALSMHELAWIVAETAQRRLQFDPRDVARPVELESDPFVAVLLTSGQPARVRVAVEGQREPISRI